MMDTFEFRSAFFAREFETSVNFFQTRWVSLLLTAGIGPMGRARCLLQVERLSSKSTRNLCICKR